MNATVVEVEEAAVSGQSLLFRLSMYWRILYGAVRIIFGIKLLTLIGTPLTTLFTDYLGPSMAAHPHDRVYPLVQHTLQHHSFVVTYFLASYLLFWGAVDIFLSFNLLKDRIWAFPISLYLIGIFMVYELLRFTHTHSLLLLMLIGVDSGIMYLIYREYQRMLGKLANAQ